MSFKDDISEAKSKELNYFHKANEDFADDIIESNTECWNCHQDIPMGKKYCKLHCGHHAEDFDDFTGKCKGCGTSLNVNMMMTMPSAEAKATEAKIERSDGSMTIDGKQVIKIWESMQGWYWYAVEDQGEYTGVGADGNDIQAHAWFGYVQADFNEWGTFDSKELERAGVWTVPKSNWGWTGKMEESKASEFSPLELYDTIEPLWNNLSENDRKKIIINTTYGFVGQDNNVKSNWNQIDHMTQQRIADNWDNAFNMIDEDKKIIYGLESKASEGHIWGDWFSDNFKEVYTMDQSGTYRCKHCDAWFDMYMHSQEVAKYHLAGHGILTESKASEDRDWDGRSDLEKLERDQELSKQFWNKSSTLNEIPDSYHKESVASEVDQEIITRLEQGRAMFEADVDTSLWDMAHGIFLEFKLSSMDEAVKITKDWYFSTTDTGYYKESKASEANGYIAFYEDQQTEIYADTSYDAQQKAIDFFNPPESKKHTVTVMIAEQDGEQVTHTFTEASEYTLEDLERVGIDWDNSSVAERKQIIIDTHNGYTEGHDDNIVKNWNELSNHTRTIITQGKSNESKASEDDLDWTKDKPEGGIPFYCPLCHMTIEENATWDGVFYHNAQIHNMTDEDAEILAKGFTYSNSPPTSFESKASEGRFRVADQGEMTIYDTLEEATSHAKVSGSPIWDMDKKEFVWFGESKANESKEEEHGFTISGNKARCNTCQWIYDKDEDEEWKGLAEHEQDHKTHGNDFVRMVGESKADESEDVFMYDGTGDSDGVGYWWDFELPIDEMKHEQLSSILGIDQYKAWAFMTSAEQERVKNYKLNRMMTNEAQLMKEINDGWEFSVIDHGYGGGNMGNSPDVGLLEVGIFSPDTGDINGQKSAVQGYMTQEDVDGLLSTFRTDPAIAFRSIGGEWIFAGQQGLEYQSDTARDD